MKISADDLSSQETYNLWRASQFFVEVTLLRLWGAKEIHNRTRLPIVEVYGQDMLAERRGGEIDIISES